MSLCFRVLTTTGFLVVAFFFSLVMNQLVHSIFPPSIANYVVDGVSAVQIVLILYATGFMDCIHCKKK